ncbi:helix-turn-helix domain-containing protein [Streptomyces sp. NPDC006997]|uniref:helix-turn-helix domain-containing protein n=1 Tax=Streptomyces sp. NPDC006997 TaxID=3155356 RepID=UPI0033E04B47
MNYHGTTVREQALTLMRGGTKNADVARSLNVPVGTVGYWKHRDRAKRGECPGAHQSHCPRCEGELDDRAYAYLLGLYLGDGHVIQNRAMRAPSLSITCADAHPGLMAECETAMRSVFPHNSVCRVRRKGCHDVKVYSKHMWCLFPQHGPGKKHERPIALEPWQQAVVDTHPWGFVRGLIHSDGCRVTNWTTRVVAGEKKRYEYPRYFFSNKSDDVRRLCTDALDKLGIEWTHCARDGSPFNVSVARKASVALMDAHVGPKY